MTTETDQGNARRELLACMADSIYRGEPITFTVPGHGEFKVRVRSVEVDPIADGNEMRVTLYW